MPDLSTIGTRRWPKVCRALLNINKQANRLRPRDDDFPAKADEIALRLETAAAHARDIAKECREQQ